jgi:predicted SAM-dependent methyltransferase
LDIGLQPLAQVGSLLCLDTNGSGRVIVQSVRAIAKAAYLRLAAPAQIRQYLAESGSPRLNIGCGYNVLQGWMNVDLTGGRRGTIHMDATRRLTLPDNTFDAILCEHLIEHLTEADGRHLIGEMLRVLKPGGRVRIVTPDLESLAQLCTSAPDEAGARYLAFVAELHRRPKITPADALNYIFYEYGHRHIYTIAKLRKLLEEAGFTGIGESRAGQPIDRIFDGAEGHPQFMGEDNDAFEAFGLEAAKPGHDTSALARVRA